ncbi:protein of unknown function [Mucilaginibacter gossypiicola]|uniref:DUF5013 domain-containing protein n=1 Tax=Mucilaginibacter gossypiicola TaxID=551995 RepID=A0A1H8TUG6_9SPHI|nr:DUF4998 domain-containing protein [Mucilaginibacter gossypiicola]SEO94642.1 protein of unknown function [Mucilaginibacter gossypiicola]
MKINIKNIAWLLLLLAAWGCSKKNENYKELIKGSEIYYPGVIANANYRAGKLRTQLVWNPSPDPKIVKYKIYWNNKQDSLIIDATSHNPLDTVKVMVSNLTEGTYNFVVNSVDSDGHISIAKSINGVRVYGAIYAGGIFNRGYNADNPFTVDITTGVVKLNFNQITLDSVTVNTKTIVTYIDNAGKTQTTFLKPTDSIVTINDFKFGTDVTYQSSYLPFRGAIDTFTVAAPTLFPRVRRIGDITSLYIKNAGYPFYRSDNGTGKWGLPKDWQYNSNVVNQNGSTGGGWSTDNGGCIHFEAKDWGGDGVNNGKVYQTITLPAGNYALDIETAGYGGSLNANEIVAVGNSLPDITNLGSPLAIYKGDQNNIGGTHTLNFTLLATTTITLGWVVNTQSYTYLQFKGVKLRSL